MRGEFIGIWPELRRELWDPMAELEAAPDDLFCELFRAVSVAFRIPMSTEELANIVDNPVEARTAFYGLTNDSFANERALVFALEQVLEAMDDLVGDELSNPYFFQLEGVIQKFSLRYKLSRPCILSPTLSGIFSSLIRGLRNHTNADPHLSSLMDDFELSVEHIRSDNSANHIKTCIQKQMNLLEALGGRLPAVTGNTLGAICNQANTWPHAQVKSSIKE
ncbi:MAG: hypothetical protein EOP06_32245, partial [Proteobacteria bacterium]